MTTLTEAAERVRRAANAYKSASERLEQAGQLRNDLEWLTTELQNELKNAERALRSLATEEKP